MKEIKLQNSDKKAIVDDCDYEFVNKYNWYLHTDGYAVRYEKAFSGELKIIYMDDMIRMRMNQKPSEKN